MACFLLFVQGSRGVDPLITRDARYREVLAFHKAILRGCRDLYPLGLHGLASQLKKCDWDDISDLAGKH